MTEVLRDKPTHQAVLSVHAFSTGSGEQHPEHRHGSRLPQMLWVLASRRWLKIPINVYVLEHRDGLVLFDAGLDPAIASDPNYINSTIGRFLFRKLFRLHIAPDQSVAHGLKRLGFDPVDVKKVIVSHLHFDHVGGIGQLPNAELHVSGIEWQQLSSPHPERDFILADHIKLPHAKWRPIDFTQSDDPILEPFGGYYDVMGDGTMVLLSTPGHTIGSLSMLVRGEQCPPLLLVGDLTYDVALLMKDQVPGTGDAVQLRESYAKVRQLKQALPDLVILPSHDPSAADSLADATRQMASIHHA